MTEQTSWVDSLAGDIVDAWLLIEEEWGQVAQKEQSRKAGDRAARNRIAGMIRAHVDRLRAGNYTDRAAELAVKVWMDGGNESDLADVIRGAIAAALGEARTP